MGLSMCFISSLLFHLFITSLLFLGAEVLVGCGRPHVQVSYITCQNPCKMKTPSWAGLGKSVPLPEGPQRLSTADSRSPRDGNLHAGTHVHTQSLDEWARNSTRLVPSAWDQKAASLNPTLKCHGVGIPSPATPSACTCAQAHIRCGGS